MHKVRTCFSICHIKNEKNRKEDNMAGLKLYDNFKHEKKVKNKEKQLTESLQDELGKNPEIVYVYEKSESEEKIQNGIKIFFSIIFAILIVVALTIGIVYGVTKLFPGSGVPGIQAIL